jgi:hypothetical protein
MAEAEVILQDAFKSQVDMVVGYPTKHSMKVTHKTA